MGPATTRSSQLPASTSTPSRMGVLDGDLCGFPNGRRLADDVTDISLRAIAQGYGVPLNMTVRSPQQEPQQPRWRRCRHQQRQPVPELLPVRRSAAPGLRGDPARRPTTSSRPTQRRDTTARAFGGRALLLHVRRLPRQLPRSGRASPGAAPPRCAPGRHASAPRRAPRPPAVCPSATDDSASTCVCDRQSTPTNANLFRELVPVRSCLPSPGVRGDPPTGPTTSSRATQRRDTTARAFGGSARAMLRRRRVPRGAPARSVDSAVTRPR